MGNAPAELLLPAPSFLSGPVSDQSTWKSHFGSKMCSKKQETFSTGVTQTTGKRQALYNLKEIDLNGNRQTGNELTPPGGAHYLALALSCTSTIFHWHYLPLALSRPQACNCHRVAGRNFPTTWSFSPSSPFDNVIFLFVAEEDCFEPSFGILRNLNEEKCQRPE